MASIARSAALALIGKSFRGLENSCIARMIQALARVD
jgi:hypothetical protein